MRIKWSEMETRYRIYRKAMYQAALHCITGSCKHVDEVECVDMWFTAMRNAVPRSVKK